MVLDGRHTLTRVDTAGFPSGTPDELEMYLRWLAFLRDATDDAVRTIKDLTTPSRYGDRTDLCFVLVHLINETARHAGHADAVRELLDGTVGE